MKALIAAFALCLLAGCGTLTDNQRRALAAAGDAMAQHGRNVQQINQDQFRRTWEQPVQQERQDREVYRPYTPGPVVNPQRGTYTCTWIAQLQRNVCTWQ
jgi:hypothetical protein